MSLWKKGGLPLPQRVNRCWATARALPITRLLNLAQKDAKMMLCACAEKKLQDFQVMIFTQFFRRIYRTCLVSDSQKKTKIAKSQCLRVVSDFQQQITLLGWWKNEFVHQFTHYMIMTHLPSKFRDIVDLEKVEFIQKNTHVPLDPKNPWKNEGFKPPIYGWNNP